ncbi:MAG: hydroxymethylglutaryl-CoA lyase [Sphingomonadaceae bacterium]
MARRVAICEVGPRDGLQNEADIVPTEAKLGMIARALDAGIRRIEVASFVNPARVPQMADAEAVIAGLPDLADARYIGLCLNKRGVLRALATREGGRRGVDEAGCVLVASDTLGQRNQGQTIAEGIEENRQMIALAKAEGLLASVTIAAAFGCPYEGAVPARRVADLAAAMAEGGADEIALADTIGVGVPAMVAERFGLVREAVGPDLPLRAHFHDTRSTGIANAWAAVEAGVAILDASLGGLGGCPFAKGAAGNIATEDLLYLLDTSGVEHGVSLPAMVEANAWFEGVLGRALPSRAARAIRAAAA